MKTFRDIPPAGGRDIPPPGLQDIPPMQRTRDIPPVRRLARRDP